MPVAAVSRGGRPRVSSGSQIAALGIRCGLMKPSLRPSARVISAARPTSLPVPAVVGIATTGAVAARDLGDAAEDGGVVGERAGMGRQQGHALGEVDRRAAADGDHPVAALGPVELEGCLDRRLGRIGRAWRRRGRRVRGRRRRPGRPGPRTGRRHRSPAAVASCRGRPGRRPARPGRRSRSGYARDRRCRPTSGLLSWRALWGRVSPRQRRCPRACSPLPARAPPRRRRRFRCHSIAGWRIGRRFPVLARTRTLGHCETKAFRLRARFWGAPGDSLAGDAARRHSGGRPSVAVRIARAGRSWTTVGHRPGGGRACSERGRPGADGRAGRGRAGTGRHRSGPARSGRARAAPRDRVPGDRAA